MSTPGIPACDPRTLADRRRAVALTVHALLLVAGAAWLLGSMQGWWGCIGLPDRMAWRWGLFLLVVAAASPVAPTAAVVLIAALAVLGPYDQGGPYVWRDLWLTAIALSGMLVWAARTDRRISLPAPRRLVTWLMLMMVLWTLACAAAAVIRGDHWPALLAHHPLHFAVGLGLFILASVSLGRPGQSLALALVLLAALALRARVLTPAGVWRQEDIATLLAITAPLAILAPLCAVRRRSRLLLGALAGLLVAHNLYVLARTQNRNGALALLVGLLAAWALSHWRWALAPVLALAGAALVGWARYTEYFQRFTDLLTDGREADSAYQRLELWQAGWRMALDHPWLGVGPGRFPAVVSQYNPRLGALPAHNNFVAMLAETGWIGVMLYLGVFAGAIVLLWRTRAVARRDWPGPAAQALLATLLAYLCAGLFLTRHDMPLAYLLAGWAVALHNRLVGPAWISEPSRPL